MLIHLSLSVRTQKIAYKQKTVESSKFPILFTLLKLAQDPKSRKLGLNITEKFPNTSFTAILEVPADWTIYQHEN